MPLMPSVRRQSGMTILVVRREQGTSWSSGGGSRNRDGGPVSCRCHERHIGAKGMLESFFQGSGVVDSVVEPNAQ